MRWLEPARQTLHGLGTGSRGREAPRPDHRARASQGDVRSIRLDPPRSRHSHPRSVRGGGEGGGFRMLSLMSTMPGLPLYEKCGFTVTNRVDIPMPDGATIAGVAMEKALA